ncbi:protein FAM91A1-like [Oryza brachyantha]|uniref:FAM91 N-terminal domain-containing protein n=1 Tax=Oryza brachyantha TaxID=4533 RepID=J3M681_ORYBR|nr:protein FAM91A1-like [Oryza brachyantha]
MQQQMAATVEEQMMVKAIREELPWENLPKRIQAALVSKDDWNRRIVNYCIRKRLPWTSSYARKVCKEGEYYEDLMRYLRKNLALYPYHLADYICRVMRISPFKYYCDILFEAMKNEQPYDSIPNFSAADALRITGVGRNEFIDIMNKCRSKIMWKLSKSIAKELLPALPVDQATEPWWTVRFVNFTLEEFKKLSEDETSAIDKISKEEVNSYVLFDPNVIDGLYKRGMVYFDVPVYPEDRFRVSRLEGFVSNKDQSYEDPIEELLYAVFVVSSENATVAELAKTLQADLYQLQAAASFACRLGWAVKLMDTESILRDSNSSTIPSNILTNDDEGSHMSINSEKSGHELLNNDSDGPRTISGASYVGFIVDANVTSYLMMGSLSPGLKSHAVTLYEAGKLGDSCIVDLCNDLASLEGKRFEGVLQEFANHAFSLRCFLECLLSGGIAPDETIEANNQECSIQENFTKTSSKENIDEGIGSVDTSEIDHYDELSQAVQPMVNSDAADQYSSSPSSIVSECKKSTDNNDSYNSKTSQLNGSTNINPLSKTKRSYRVNILRCESLASLSPSTLERLLLRDYDIMVSMIPLPYSSILLPSTTGLVHFGPPSYSSMTPWMKLALYTSSSCGPVSAVFMKGQRLRLLPEPLASCEKALIWSWDHSVVGGLGGKFEGNLVKGCLLLHYLNSMTKHSAVIVQPLSTNDLDETGNLVTVDIPLPLKNIDGSIVSTIASIGLPEEQILNLSSLLYNLSSKIELGTVGYLSLVRLHRISKSNEIISKNGNYEWIPLSLEFGIPLFNPKLCERICERVVESCMLQKDDISEHYEAMQNVRKRLRELCAEYQATGPTARLFNQRGNSKNSPRQLINIVSGRWSPFHDTLTPNQGGSPREHDRLKVATRQKCFTEVLSFDGSILRSYALAPVYEAATRTVHEDQPTTPVAKPEPDDADTKDVVLPGVNLIFDGAELHPFDIGACLQARQPISLIAEASSSSLAMK